ncbi:GAF domain-containing protein [Methanolobus sp. ZRKC3]|uniref:sensor histidine kinase n=1 Tax=Methanolobus sp. ZRKC3 TaxID=3125786 RepID=UPI00324F7F69
MQSENEYRMVFENSPLPITYFDQNGMISLCNEKLSNILNMQKKEIIGLNMADIFTDKEMQNVIRRAISGEPAYYQGEFYPHGKDEAIEIEIHCNPNISSQDSPNGSVCILEDVTSRMELEEALKLDEYRLEALLELEQMTEAPMQQITDFVHEQAVRLTQSKIGYIAFLSDDESNLIMHTWSDSVMNECTVPDKKFVYPVEAIGLWGEPIRQRKPCIINDYPAQNPLKKGYPSGHVEVYNYLGIPVFDGERIVATVGVGNKDGDYDRTDARQLTLLMQGLWNLIQRREDIENLREYAEELERSNEMKDLFTDILRHDLLNPAGIIKGYTDVLLESEDDEERMGMLKTIDRNNSKLIDIIRSAASFAKLDTIDSIEFNDMDIALMLRRIVENLKPLSDEKQMFVEDIPNGSYMAKVNPMIEEVFVNLLSNAIKYSPEKERIIIDILDYDEDWKVTFTDFGTGVKDEDKPKLFERFKRVDKSGVKGTGLGLAIAKKITELHGGHIGVEDNPAAKGSVFWVTLKKA